MHIPNTTRLILCEVPELQLFPEQQLVEVETLHDMDGEGHEGASPVVVLQSSEFGSLHPFT